MSTIKHQANRESDYEYLDSARTNSDSKSSPTAGDRSGSVGNIAVRNPGDNHDQHRDSSEKFHNRQGQVHLDTAVDSSDNKLHETSTVMGRGAAAHDDPTPGTSEQNLELKSDRHQHIGKEQESEDEQQSSLVDRCRVAFNFDTNNNGHDNHNIGEEKEGANYTLGPLGDISDLNLSGVATSSISNNQSLQDNRGAGDKYTSAILQTTGVRRRKVVNRAHNREEKLNCIDLIGLAAAEQLNYDDRQRYKRQKLEIMKVDGRETGSKSSNNPQAASAYFCRLSKDDFGTTRASGTFPHQTNKSSSQSDIFKCDQNETSSDDSVLDKTLSSLKNCFYFPNKGPKLSSKLKKSNATELQDRKIISNNVLSNESADTSSVTDEDKSPDMAINNKSGYKTFKGSQERRSSRSKRKQSRESQRRLSQISGYSKLDHHHYQTTGDKHSFVQELKRIALLLAIILISCWLLWELYELLLGETSAISLIMMSNFSELGIQLIAPFHPANYNFLGVVKTPSILGEYDKFAVSTDAEPCAKVGSDLLAIGGSAVDAAIGTLVCMGVILPNSLGLGGGCLMTIYDAKSKQAVVIDGRETAPDYAHENMFANDSLMASRGPLSIGVPGELAAYWKAHQRFGKLKWSHLFNESIKFAQEGYPVVDHLANALQSYEHARYMTPSMKELFTHPEGRYYQRGELFAQPALAKTLKRIRDNGVEEFYTGQTGQNFIQDLKDQGGKMTLTDLMKYQAIVREPLKVRLADDLVLHTQPPPGSGIVLSIIMRIMHKLGYYKNLKPQASFEAAELYYHRLAEAFKFAYGQRAGLEDEPDDPERMKQLMDRLLSDEFIEEIANKVDTKTHDNDYYGGLEYFRDDHGTAHVSVLDSEGNAAAVSTSVNLYFGAGMYSPSTGITYNDVMDDFVSPHLTNKFGLAPSKYNHIKPGRRPLSSMVPSVFTDSEGNVRLVVGGAGGTKITTGVAMVSLRNCFLQESIKTSIDGPRIHHQFLPNELHYEVNFPKDLIRSFIEIRNHTTKPIVGRSSVVMAVASERTTDNKTRITANSDYRKGGSVHGQ